MIKFKIICENKNHKPGLYIEPGQGDLWNLSELNSCSPEYILNEVLPNLEKILRGEKVQDPTRPDEHLVDFYEFGYDATIIDFYRNTSIINYGYWEGKIELNSDVIYTLMQEWGNCLRQWEKERNDKL